MAESSEIKTLFTIVESQTAAIKALSDIVFTLEAKIALLTEKSDQFEICIDVEHFKLIDGVNKELIDHRAMIIAYKVVEGTLVLTARPNNRNYYHMIEMGIMPWANHKTVDSDSCDNIEGQCSYLFSNFTHNNQTYPRFMKFHLKALHGEFWSIKQ